ncbi:hypothetical protein Bbelb_219470 [Branchiostoma belcheri]|nr:hypothetical protein Bbelb_219470 [Branchiostoma belcheri]
MTDVAPTSRPPTWRPGVCINRDRVTLSSEPPSSSQNISPEPSHHRTVMSEKTLAAWVPSSEDTTGSVLSPATMDYGGWQPGQSLGGDSDVKFSTQQAFQTACYPLLLNPGLWRTQDMPYRMMDGSSGTETPARAEHTAAPPGLSAGIPRLQDNQRAGSRLQTIVRHSCQASERTGVEKRGVGTTYSTSTVPNPPLLGRPYAENDLITPGA